MYVQPTLDAKQLPGVRVNRPSPKQLADAKAMIRADRAARKAERPARIDHKAEPVKANRGRVRDNAYLAYLRRQPCERCGTTQAVEAAHIRCSYPEDGWSPTGMQVKPSDFRALSLCAHCHREGPDAQHRMSERTFWAALNIYPPERCAEVHADFLAGRDQPRRAA